MDSTQSSAPRSGGRDSTRSLLATPKNIQDAASWLLLDEDQADTFRRCLEGEPLKRLLGITDWLARHEADPGYDPSAMVVMWAKKRGAGCFRPSEAPFPNRAAQRIWYGSSDAEYAEIDVAVDGTIQCRVESMWQCAACSGRFRGEPYEAQEGNGKFHQGDVLCPGCAKRHDAA